MAWRLELVSIEFAPEGAGLMSALLGVSPSVIASVTAPRYRVKLVAPEGAVLGNLVVGRTQLEDLRERIGLEREAWRADVLAQVQRDLGATPTKGASP